MTTQPADHPPIKDTPCPEIGSVEHIEATGHALITAFRTLLHQTLGNDYRAIDLTHRLAIDKSLASRITRSVSSESAFEALHEAAAPRGLSQIVAACRAHGASGAAVRSCEEAIRAYEMLLEFFPDGRKGLATVLGSRVDRAKSSADREAQRSIFKGMVHLRGFRIDTVYAGGVFLPSAEDPTRVDFVRISARFGLRRMRHGFSAHLTSLPTTGEPRGLEGGAFDVSRDLLLREFSSPLNESDIVESAAAGSARHFALVDRVPELNQAVDLVTAIRFNATAPRYASGPQRYEDWTTKMGGNAEVVIFDVFLHEDIYPDAEPPVLTCVWGNLLPMDRRALTPERLIASMDPLDQDVERHSYGRGLRGAYSRDVHALEGLLSSSFSRMRQDPNRFRHHRFRQQYPVGNAAFTFWFKMPDAERG